MIDFYQQLNELLVINGQSPIPKISTLHAGTPKELQLTEWLFKNHFDNKQSFIEKTVINENGLFLHISNLSNKTVYKIKTEDIHTQSPLCFDAFNNSFSLVNVLLVELALWLFQHVAQHKTVYTKNVKGLHENVKINFLLISVSKWFSLYQREHCYIITSDYSAGTYLVATNNKTLNETKAIVKTTEAKKENIVLKSVIIPNLTLKNGIAKGTFSFLGEPAKVELDTELEFPQQQDYEKLQAQLEEFIRYFPDDKFNEYKMQMAKEITDSAYEQNEYIPKAEDYKALYDELILKKIYITSDAFVLTFNAKKTYKKNGIFFQISYPGFEIEETTIG